MSNQNDLSSTLTQLHASPEGLTSDEARKRLEQYGFNEAISAKRTLRFIRFLSFFANPLALILRFAAIVTGILGDRVNASVIIVIVVLSATLDFVQTLRSQNAADKLRNQVAPTATLLRDGKASEILRRELVPGDVIRLIAGDLVPADARLLASRDLHVNQATLTGESMSLYTRYPVTNPFPSKSAVVFHKIPKP